jgi:putative Ca2+/H+ antiporter (TMEM165/GDT1 family)
LEAFLVSITSVAVAEMGDRTQLLSLVLAARYRRPWPILIGILLATLASHTMAGIVGAWFGRFLEPATLEIVVGVSMMAMALWTLKPDRLAEEGAKIGDSGVLAATFIAFFIAELGDKTQIATLALAAAYTNLAAVIIGTTCGMLIANTPVVLLGNAFASRLPLKAIHIGAAALFALLGVLFVVRGLR